MNNEAVQAALSSLQHGEEYYAIECPQCRRINKISIHKLERSLPRGKTAANLNDHQE